MSFQGKCWLFSADRARYDLQMSSARLMSNPLAPIEARRDSKRCFL